MTTRAVTQMVAATMLLERIAVQLVGRGRDAMKPRIQCVLTQ